MIRVSGISKTFDADGDGVGGGLYTLGTQAVERFYALLGDGDGDGNGNGNGNGNAEVDAQDLLNARLALRKTVGHDGGTGR